MCQQANTLQSKYGSINFQHLPNSDNQEKKEGKVFSWMVRTWNNTLYRSYIRPILTYACPIFSNCADCHMRRLQILQNTCLRMVLNAPFRTRIKTLHKKSGIPMIRTFVEKLTENFYKQSIKSSNKLVSRLGDYSRLSGLTFPKHKLPRPMWLSLELC